MITLKTDLLGKIVNGDINVFKRLSIHEVEDAVVSSVRLETKSLSGLGFDDFVSAVAIPIGNDPRHWCTIRPPIWASMTLKYLRGANTAIPTKDQPPTPVHHRLALRTVGCSLWRATSERDLLTGFRDALQAHKELCDLGILHRDISAGNVLLAAHQQAPIKGFITDLDFAYHENKIMMSPEVHTTVVDSVNKYSDSGRFASRTEPTIRKHTKFSFKEVKHGVPMSGPAQFMAWEHLQADTLPHPVKHEKKHDVESFIWVLSYCVMRFLLSHQSDKASATMKSEFDELKYLFHSAFGQTTRDAIAAERAGHCRVFSFISNSKVCATTKYSSEPVAKLFSGLRTLIHAASPFMPDPISLTHEAVLAQVNTAIESLQ